MDAGKLPNHVNIVLCILWHVFSLFFVSHRLGIRFNSLQGQHRFRRSYEGDTSRTMVLISSALRVREVKWGERRQRWDEGCDCERWVQGIRGQVGFIYIE